MELPNALPAGHALLEYRIERVLGVGGFGLTYLALDENLHLKVAVKEYLPADIALRAPDRFGMLLAAGVTAWVVGQAAINIGAVIGLLPVSGIPLPFISFGGSALVFTMVAAGILGNVARQAR